MAFRAPLLGYNTNVRHKGRLYHIQTEDSGIDHPHVITHLFADGGRIVASKKTSYADRVGGEGLPDIVKKLMQAQHKAMFIALRDGQYDEDGPHDAASEQTGTHSIPPPGDPAGQPADAAPAVAAPESRGGDALLERAARAELSVAEKLPVSEKSVAARLPLPDQSVAAKLPASELSVAEKLPVAKPPLSAKPPKPGRSLFGGDPLNDKGLDEVILNYLAANEKDV